MKYVKRIMNDGYKVEVGLYDSSGHFVFGASSSDTSEASIAQLEETVDKKLAVLTEGQRSGPQLLNEQEQFE